MDSGYLKLYEDSCKEEYNGKNILFVGSRSLFLSGNKKIDDETIEKNIKDVLDQLSSIVGTGINIKFLTDFFYRGLSNDLKIDEKDFHYTRGDLIEKTFELSEKLGIDKVVYLTKKAIEGLMYGKKERINYVNPNMLKKLKIIGRNKNIIERIIGLIENSMVSRFHFINILKSNALYDELFTLYGAGSGDGVLVSLDYKLEIEKLKDIQEQEILFLYSILEDLSENDGFVKYKSLEYIKENKDNFYAYKIDGASVGMFEVKDLGHFSREIGTVILDPNFQGGGIGTRMIGEIIDLHNTPQYEYFNFIIVTGNDNLKKILANENNIEIINEQDVSNDSDLSTRYEKMLSDNESDEKNREMYIIKAKE